MKSFPNAKVGFSKAMSAGWITVKKNEDGGPRVFRKVDTIVDSVQHVLQKISVGDMTDIPDEQLKEFKKRKLIDMVVVKSYTVTKGSAFSTSIDKLETDLTPEMLARCIATENMSLVVVCLTILSVLLSIDVFTYLPACLPVSMWDTVCY
jgi:phenylalanyl-tRNA synthetase alpha chain